MARGRRVAAGGPLARLGQAAARAEAADGEGQEGRAEAPDRPALVEDDPGAVLGVEPALARRLVAVLVHERLGTRVGILARATPGVVGRPRPALHHLLAFRVDVRDLHQALVAMLAGEVVHVGAIGVAGAKNAALSAAAILALSDTSLQERLQSFRSAQTQQVLDTKLPET